MSASISAARHRVTPQRVAELGGVARRPRRVPPTV